MTAMILLSEWERSQVEFWKPIEGFQGYDVSSKGRVRSWRLRNGKPSNVWRLISIRQDRSYLSVTITGERGRRQRFVHTLVAEAFCGKPTAREVNHLSGVKTDNRDGNLVWVTRRQNIRHAFDVGLFSSRAGEANASAKLSESQVREIFLRVKAGENGAVIAKEFNVTRTTPSDIFNRKTWKHLNLGGG